MASNNRGNNRNRGSNRNRGRNHNPEGHNQYSGVMSSARENPLAAAAAVGGAVAAGVFLWSRRNQITDQIGSLSDQISEWREGFHSDSEFGGDADTATESFIASPRRRGGRKSQSDIAEEAMTLKTTGSKTTA